MRLATQLAHYGFDVERVKFGGRTALGACLALLVAWLMGLEHPQWSAMTVWAASQPVRGMLIEKSLFRALGTVVGTAFGVLLIYLAGGDNLVIMLGLVLWVGLCAAAGNAVSGLVSYGTLLSGYSASMVALLNTADPSVGILVLGQDRLLTVMTGVVVALVVGLMFSRRQEGDELRVRARWVTTEMLRHVARRLAPSQTAPAIRRGALLSEIAAIEETLEAHGAGSLRSHHSARSLRAILMANVAGMLWTKHPPAQIEHSEAIASALREAALEIEADSPIPVILDRLKRAQALSIHTPRLASMLEHLTAALEQRDHFVRTGKTDTVRLKRQFILHRDWVAARETWIRTTALLLLVGIGWVWSGSPIGAYVLLGTSVMVTLFSTMENPAWIMRHILLWQIVGAIASLVCRWVLWPLASSELQMVLMMMPFILIIVIPFAHHRTMTGSMDYSMVLLLLLQPAYPMTASLPGSAAVATAVVAGPLIAYLAFRFIYPTDAKRRRATLKGMMIDELRGLAGDSDAARKQHLWRSRLYHRTMKLVHWTNKVGEPTRSATHGGYAVMDVGNALISMQQLLRDGALDAEQSREVQAVLERLKHLNTDPQGGAAVLAELAISLRERGLPGAGQLEAAADSLTANRQFFTADSPHPTG